MTRRRVYVEEEDDEEDVEIMEMGRLDQENEEGEHEHESMHLLETGAEEQARTIKSVSRRLHEDDYDWVMLFAMEEECEKRCCGLITQFNETNIDEQHKIKMRLKNAGLLIHESKSRDGDEIIVRVTAPVERMEEEAEKIGLKMLLREEEWSKPVVPEAPRFPEYGVFSMKRKHLFQASGNPECMFSSGERQRIVLHIIESPTQCGGAGINRAKGLEKGMFRKLFPLHDPTMQRWLVENWSKAFMKTQPLEEIRVYYGEKIALYFAWLGLYLTYLWLPGLMGAAFFIYQISSSQYDNAYVPLFCIVLSFWATFFLEGWKRRNAELVFLWDMMDFEEEEEPRPEYYGTWHISPITGRREREYARWRRYLKYSASILVIVFMVCMHMRGDKLKKNITSLVQIVLVIMSMVAILLFREFAIKRSPALGGTGAGVLNAIVINILNTFYMKVALALNDWENHRTETEYEDKLIAKVFLFQFVNSYIVLYYIAFAKGRLDIFPKVNEQCAPSCMEELALQLGSIFITQLIIGNVKEVLVPYILFRAKLKWEDMALARGGGIGSKRISRSEEESKLEVYESTFDDYNEMIIQFGYVTLFAVAFPLAPLAAVINNLVEIRSDAFKLCTTFQRPLYRGAEDMGTWYHILEIMSILAVMTNCAIVSFTSKAFVEHSLLWRFGIAVFAEHVVLGIKFIIAEAIPDTPGRIRVAMERRKYCHAHMNDEDSGSELSSSGIDDEYDEEYEEFEGSTDMDVRRWDRPQT